MEERRRATDRLYKILCIDDESDNLRILSAAFREDYQVIACKSGEAGLRMAREHRPDLILLDIVMPDISGFEVIERIKADPGLCDIPVIFITGLQTSDDEEKGLRLGACDYISKPFNLSVVRARVNTHTELLRQRRLLERFANFDALTEVPNRLKWQSDIARLWSAAEESGEGGAGIVVGVADIDFFKMYNDRYGHQKGDIALRKVAKAIERTLFDEGGHIYRCGGEEFYFHFPASTEAGALSMLRACRDVVADLGLRHEDSTVHDSITVSLGAVLCRPAGEMALEDVLGQADRHLYEVKKTTRNGFCLGTADRSCAVAHLG